MVDKSETTYSDCEETSNGGCKKQTNVNEIFEVVVVLRWTSEEEKDDNRMPLRI